MFTVSELANISGTDAHAANVGLGRLLKAGLIVRYAQGRYGLPGVVHAEDLVPQLDSCAYITGHWLLHSANLVDQRPTMITCFTSRRHNRSRIRQTPFGRVEFTTVQPPVYARPLARAIAVPEQAICDFVYLCLRGGLRPDSLVRFRSLDQLSAAELDSHAAHYPRTVQRCLRELLSR